MILTILIMLLITLLAIGYLFQFIVAIIEMFSSYSDIKTKQDLIDAFIPYRPLYLKVIKIWNRLE